MARALKPATPRDVHKVRVSIERLKDARDQLLEAGADTAAAKVRLALSSAEGALRHVIRRAAETEQLESR